MFRLDYPGVGPEHSFLKDMGRAEYHSVTDEEALNGMSFFPFMLWYISLPFRYIFSPDKTTGMREISEAKRRMCLSCLTCKKETQVWKT